MPSRASERVQNALRAVDRYVRLLRDAAEGSDVEIVGAAEHAESFLQGAPQEDVDAARDVCENILLCTLAVLRRQEADCADKEKEARARRVVSLQKAFVVLLLLITTVVLWSDSSSALFSVVPIAFIVYLLFGDFKPLRLFSSPLKKDDK